jgi:hypothetical protein
MKAYLTGHEIPGTSPRKPPSHRGELNLVSMWRPLPSAKRATGATLLRAAHVRNPHAPPTSNGAPHSLPSQA